MPRPRMSSRKPSFPLRRTSSFKRHCTLGTFKGWLRNRTRWQSHQLRKRIRTFRWQTACPRLRPARRNRRPGECRARSHLGGGLAGKFAGNGHGTRQTPRQGGALSNFRFECRPAMAGGKVAQTLGVNIGRVYLAKHRVMALIKKEIRALEKNGKTVTRWRVAVSSQELRPRGRG